MGMQSVRLDKELHRRLRAAARLSGEPVSQVIRAAIDEYVDHVLGRRLDRRLEDVIGVIESEGGRARRSGMAFTEILTTDDTNAP